MNHRITDEPEADIAHVVFDGGAVAVATDPEPESTTRPAVFPSTGEFPVYDEYVYQTMTTDTIRNDGFTAALKGVVAGRRVLDIGTGAHLNWAKEALELGAASAVGVEAMQDSFASAELVRQESGLGGRLELMCGLSTDISLAERADVCVAEVIGSLAGAEGAAAVITDAKRRLLSANCVIVPHRAATRVAAACLRDLLADHPVAFSAPALPYLEKVFSWNSGPFDVRLRISRPRWATLLSDSAEAEVLEFNGDLRTEQKRSIDLTIDREGEVDGLLAWIRLWCGPDSDPIDTLRDDTNWASIYFPLFDEAVRCQPGDSLRIAIRVRLAADRIHPVYYVDGSLTRGGSTLAEGHHLSNFGGSHFRKQALHRKLFPLSGPAEPLTVTGPRLAC